MHWRGEHYFIRARRSTTRALIRHNDPYVYDALSFGFELGTFASLEAAFQAVLDDYETRIRRVQAVRV